MIRRKQPPSFIRACFQIPRSCASEKLSAGGDPKAQQCGWLKDQFGVSWQVVPTILIELLTDPDLAKSQKVMQAILQMKKIEIDELKRAVVG